MSVGLNLPEGLPRTGVYTSDQGSVSIAGSDGEAYELMKVSRATIHYTNSIGLYLEANKRCGTTFRGIPRVTGTISRALINFNDLRLILGADPTTGVVDYYSGVAVKEKQLDDLFKLPSAGILTGGGGDATRYPLVVDVSLDINTKKIPQSGFPIVDAKLHTITAKRCIMSSYGISYDADGLITSGPMSFLGSYAEWRYT